MEDNKYKFLILELGIAILNDDNEILHFKKFHDPLKSHIKLKMNDFEEISENLEFFKFKPSAIVTNYPSLIGILKKISETVEKISPNEERLLQINKKEIYSRIGIFENDDSKNNDETLNSIIRDFSLKWSSLKVQEASAQLDLHISQSVNALDEIDKILNTVGTRVREWYGLHFPELDNLLQNIVTYASIVSKSGERNEITRESLAALEIPENKIEIIIDTAHRSKGGKITEENLSILQDLADQVISLSQIRKTLEGHIESSMDEIAPNMKELLTATVGARLIAKAGSLKRLASLSSSTIQILGAEKALFRTLKTGANPPKHGLLFQHPVIHSAPKWQRGKLARAISAKAAIAARVDLYGQTPLVDNMLSSKLNDRIVEIQQKYKEPSEPQKLRSQEQTQRFRKGDNKRYNGNKRTRYGKRKDEPREKDRDFKFKRNKYKKRFHKSNKK
ncbi:NOP5/NOP56 family protein [Candidatus Nitrosocosmicus franklandus]|uniref:Putative snoRNA binding domain protein n=1 Tax=Candidatus Nitrosocosmicus franklandianus TaxID=1798806 RepID=A0A484IKA8_9ARCH|nr:ribonucleotide-diphosphate reductase subunit beta [Candidatus Nitrosocosmicus franklandus]VFJ15339.1 putative snoRNA binding domain protein [Candidatus Nitrosocosmicus franklandus]